MEVAKVGVDGAPLRVSGKGEEEQGENKKNNRARTVHRVYSFMVE